MIAWAAAFWCSFAVTNIDERIQFDFLWFACVWYCRASKLKRRIKNNVLKALVLLCKITCALLERKSVCNPKEYDERWFSLCVRCGAKISAA